MMSEATRASIVVKLAMTPGERTAAARDDYLMGSVYHAVSQANARSFRKSF